MPTFVEIMTEVTTLFNGLGLLPLVAVSAVIGGVGLLARRVLRAAR